MNENFDLSRFVQAQDPIYDHVLKELRAGQKRSHWMWFIFPQVIGLGRSATSQRYAIRSTKEALAYLAHPVLGERLRECAEILLQVEGKSAHQIFSSPDDMKLKSSMTLFAEISPPGSVFEEVLEKYFNNRRCRQTMRFLGST